MTIFGKVKAKRAGKAIITVKVKNKTLKCSITVRLVHIFIDKFMQGLV